MLTATVINNGKQMLNEIQNLKTALKSNLTQYLVMVLPLHHMYWLYHHDSDTRSSSVSMGYTT
jgi:hypothetical protein